MPDVHPLHTLPVLSVTPATSEAEYDREIRGLRANLRQTPISKIVGNSPSRACSVLDTIDPSEQSLVYLYVLASLYQTADTTNFADLWQPGGDIWSRSVRFLREFDPIQVRYAGHEWAGLVGIVAHSAELASRPLLAVQPIKHALIRLDPSGSTFTSAHTILVRLCLRAMTYTAALPVLERTICHIPARSDEQHLKKARILLSRPQLASATYVTPETGLSGKLNYRQYLEYFFYGALIYMGLKRWNDALHFLRIVISAPANNSVSAIMVQAYTKWVLVSLLANGTVLPIPKAVNPHAAKLYKALGKAYDLLADVFRAGSFSRLKAEVQAGESIWAADNNTGLVFQLVEAYRRFSILALERTFAAISVKDIPNAVLSHAGDTPALEKFAVSLIGSGNLKARLVQPCDSAGETVLRFNVDPTRGDYSSETGAWNSLEAQKDRIRPLMESVHNADFKLELSTEYVESIRRARRNRDDGNGGGLLMGNRDDIDPEEDIMAGAR